MSVVDETHLHCNNNKPSTSKIKGAVSDYMEKKKLKYTFSSMINEESGCPIFCIEFNYFLETCDMFACAIKDYISIYECFEDGGFKLLGKYVAHPQEKEQFYACAWSRAVENHEPLLVSGGLRGVIQVVRTKSMKCSSRLIGHTGAINELKIHPIDESLLLSASSDSLIGLWNIETFVAIAVFGGRDGHRGPVLSIDFPINGYQFASCSTDRTINFWCMGTGPIQKAISDSYTFSPEETHLPFRTYYEEESDFSILNMHANYAGCVRWKSRDWLISKTNNNLLAVWKPNLIEQNSVKIWYNLESEGCNLFHLKFNLDSSKSILALGNTSGNIFVWNVDAPIPSLVECVKLSHICSTSTIRDTAFSRNGLIVIGGAENGSIWRWDRE